MASTSVGSIHYDLGLDTSKFDAAQKNLGGKLANLGGAFGGVADTLGSLMSKVVLVGIAGSAGIGAMTTAAFDQVRQVENASFALKAYEKDAGKVSKVLGSLVEFARSDMGVLFQRQDLFDAAATLKIFGNTTETLTDKVKILSKGVAIGKTTFQELSSIVGRAGATGKLTAVDFDMLVDRGIGLDRSMRGTSVTADDLFKALDKALPDALLVGRANTIDGAMIRMQSAFRDLGGAILGVDKDTSQFITGGLGDRFVKILDVVRQKLRDPALVQSFAQMGKAIADFAEKAVPKLIEGFTWIMANIPSLVAGFQSLIVMYGLARLAGLGAAIASAGIWGPIATAIILLVGIITYLQIRFDIFGQAASRIAPVIETLKNTFNTFWLFIQPFRDWVANTLVSAWDSLKRSFEQVSQAIAPFMPQLQVLGAIIAVSLLAPIAVAIAVFVAVVAAVIAVITIFAWLIAKITEVGAWLMGLGSRALIAMSQFTGAISQKVNEAVSWFAGLPGRIMGALGNLGGLLVNAGGDMISGLVRGISNGTNSVVQKIKDICSQSLNAVKSFFGIKSPSRIMAKQGNFIMQGMGVGLQKGTSAVIRTANQSMQLISDQMNGSAQIGAILGSSQSSSVAAMASANLGGGQAGGSTTVNIGAINNSQDEAYVLRRMDRNSRLESMGGAAV